MKKNLSSFLNLAIIASFLALTILPAIAMAQIFVSDDIDQQILNELAPIEDVYNPQGYTDPDDLSEMIATIIKAVLGLLGIIFLALMVYAGFVWMTAAGNEEKVGKAKKIMSSAIIGVIIVIAAYIITIFVFDVVLEATGIHE